MEIGSQFHTTGKTALSNHQVGGRLGPGDSTNIVKRNFLHLLGTEVLFHSLVNYTH
jgi:hypothetical protein